MAGRFLLVLLLVLDEGSSLSSPTVISVAGLDFEAPTSLDLEVIQERQLGHDVTAFSVGHRCKHGFPQAVGFSPVSRAHNGVSSCLFRLSCPHLVKEIDLYEREGGIEAMNELLARDDALKKNYRKTNAEIGRIRAALVENAEGARERISSRLGEQTAERLIMSGIAGVTKEDDAKCLHAHTADFLCRESTQSNEIGSETLRILAEERGVDVDGSNVCWQQCDPTHQVGSESWRYDPQKNKLGLKLTRERRRARLAEEEAKAKAKAKSKSKAA